MAQPAPYIPAYNFTGFQTASPSSPLPADKLDTELANIKITTDQVRANMALLQADDGTLKSNTVSPYSFNTAALALLSSTGIPRGAWLTATAYAAKDIVAQGTATYICVTAHTSGVFATDLAANKWVLIAGSTGTVSFSSLSDVSLTSPAASQLAKYDGSKWVNGLLVNANITAGTITFASMAAAFSITDTGLSGASNTNVPTTTAVKTYIDTQISRGTGTPVASAGTTSLTGTYDYVHVTGTMTITAVTLATDEEVWVVFDGAATLTHNSVSLILPSGANITTAANDRAKLRGIDGTNVICLDYVRASGQALVAAAVTAVVSVKQQTFTSSGTYTPSAGMLYCIIEMVGGGGGGGGCSSSGNAGGGGGSAGSPSKSTCTAASIGGSQTVTIGAAGAAGSTSGGDGGAGGTTSVGAVVTAPGGNGGSGTTGNVAKAGGAPGSTGTANVAGTGGPGGGAFPGNTNISVSGFGGSSMWGGGGVGVLTANNGNDGTGYGAGGSGALNSGGGAGKTGGAGTKGVVYIMEFCSQ